MPDDVLPAHCKPQTEADAERVAGYAMALIARGWIPSVPGMTVEVAPLLRVTHT